MTLITCHDKTFRPYISAKRIQARLEELGRQINQRYAGQVPIFLSVLNGAFRVINGLIEHIDIDCELSFIKLKSYSGTQSTGEVQTLIGLDLDLKGRHVVLVEDIVDTGKTLHDFLPQLAAMQPASMTVCTLLLKPDALQYPDLPLDYIGFEVENKFLIGYGLDYDGHGRQHNDIYQLAD